MFNYILQNLLLNLFFVVFPLIFYQFVLNENIKFKKTALKNVVTYLIFAIPVVLCLVFPINQEQHFMYDLRGVPLLLSFFYSNSIISLLVSLTLIGTRMMIGGSEAGAILTILSTSGSYIFVVLILKKYHLLSLRNKLVIAFFVSFASKFTLKILYLKFDPDYDLGYAVIFYIVEGAIMALTVYIIESIRKNMSLRNEIMESEKLKVASVISASVAHEIRNPLTVVRGFIQLLSAPSELNLEQKKYYGQLCLHELDRAQQIISDYLSLARPNPEVIESININDEIRYVSSVLASYAVIKNVEIVIESEPMLHILGDRQKLRQALINIAKNGIEAMEQGGEIKFNAAVQRNQAIITITDCGVGMTPEQINRLGTPYFSTKDKGTGLGTMVSFSIIRGMSGEIHVTSKQGQGSQFRISFPAVG